MNFRKWILIPKKNFWPEAKDVIFPPIVSRFVVRPSTRKFGGTCEIYVSCSRVPADSYDSASKRLLITGDIVRNSELAVEWGEHLATPSRIEWIYGRLAILEIAWQLIRNHSSRPNCNNGSIVLLLVETISIHLCRYKFLLRLGKKWFSTLIFLQSVG